MPSTSAATFDAHAFLNAAGTVRTVTAYRIGQVIYAQGDPCEHVLYLQQGRVKLSVVSTAGREAVLGLLRRGDFFSEGCLAGHAVTKNRAIAMAECRVLTVEIGEMRRLLHAEHAMSDRFIAHLLARNIRIEEDLVDQLFNASEQRLARALLLLARYSQHDEPGADRPATTLPNITQTTLAEIVGTTRSRVNFFMKKFERLGLIDRTDGLTVKPALREILLRK